MTCGIYEIVSPSGKRYIGQSKNIENRWKTHLRNLRKGRRICAPLRAAYAKYGEALLRFAILETCDRSQLTAREQHYMDTFRSAGLYNVAPVAGSNLGFKHSDESRAKMSAERAARFADPGYYAKVAAQLAAARSTEHAKARRIESGRAQWQNDEFRKRKSEQSRQQAATRPDRAEVAERLRTYAQSDAHRANASERQRARFSVPHAHAEFAKKQAQRLRDPATRAKMSEAAKRRAADPAWRAQNEERLRLARAAKQSATQSLVNVD